MIGVVGGGGVDEVRSSTIAWLLEGDPAIRWQALRDLTDAPGTTVEEVRSEVARRGWGARVLALQRDDGQWGDGVRHRFWWTTLYSLVWLRDLGVDPRDPSVERAIARVRERVTWGEWHGHSPFFEGEVEPCINGRVVALGAHFGEQTDGLVDRLLEEQLEDGGWNCEAERGSTRSSFHTTICVLEGLLAYESAFGPDGALSRSRNRGEEYLLERRLLRRLTTGEEIDPAWSEPSFPPLWHYDVLRALDYFRATGQRPDARVREAIERLAGRRTTSGRWLRDRGHPDSLYEEMAGELGAENRWITLRALRVMDWFGSPPETCSDR